MPTLWMPEEELRALQAVLMTAERVDWEAYERAKAYILNPQPEPVEAEVFDKSRIV